MSSPEDSSVLEEARTIFERELEDYLREWKASLQDAMISPRSKRLSSQLAKGWITLDPSGTHVFLDDEDNISAGPAVLTGKPINRLPKKPKEPSTKKEKKEELTRFSKEAGDRLEALGLHDDAKQVRARNRPNSKEALDILKKIAEDHYSSYIRGLFSVQENRLKPLGLYKPD